MPRSQPEPITRVLRIVGNARNTGTTFTTESDVVAVRSAVGYGLLQLVPCAHNPFQLHDMERNEKYGIELTSLGMKFLGIDETKYHLR